MTDLHHVAYPLVVVAVMAAKKILPLICYRVINGPLCASELDQDECYHCIKRTVSRALC